MKKPNTPAAMAKVKTALQHIQNAQEELGRATSALGSLRFGSGQCGRVSKLYEKLHAEWYRLRNFAATDQSLSVDSEPETP